MPAPEGDADRPASVERFYRECRALACLTGEPGSNIPKLYDVGGGSGPAVPRPGDDSWRDPGAPHQDRPGRPPGGLGGGGRGGPGGGLGPRPGVRPPEPDRGERASGPGRRPLADRVRTSHRAGRGRVAPARGPGDAADGGQAGPSRAGRVAVRAGRAAGCHRCPLLASPPLRFATNCS